MARYRNRRQNFAPVWRFSLIFDTLRGGPWIRYEGNPIMELGAEGSWEDNGIRDSNLMIDPDGYLATDDGNYRMYYSGYKNTGETHWRRGIGLATSPDGITWTKYGSNPILTKGAAGSWDEYGVQAANVIKRGANDYIMIYSGVDDDWSDEDSWGIGIATSNNGINWTKYAGNPVLIAADFIGIAGNNILTFPYMIQLSDGSYAMTAGATYYTDPLYGDAFQTYAAVSEDGLTWTPLNGGNAVFTPTGEEFDSNNIEYARLYEIQENKYLITYHGDPAGVMNNRMEIGLATSIDLINWVRYGVRPIFSFGSGDEWDDFSIGNGVLAKDDFGTDTLRMWYGGVSEPNISEGEGFGYATSDQRT